MIRRKEATQRQKQGKERKSTLVTRPRNKGQDEVLRREMKEQSMAFGVTVLKCLGRVYALAMHERRKRATCPT